MAWTTAFTTSLWRWPIPPGTSATWRSTASRSLATACTLTPRPSVTWFYSWTTRTHKAPKTRPCSSFWRSETEWTVCLRWVSRGWTSSPAFYAIGWNWRPARLFASTPPYRPSARVCQTPWITRPPSFAVNGSSTGDLSSKWPRGALGDVSFGANASSFWITRREIRKNVHGCSV